MNNLSRDTALKRQLYKRITPNEAAALWFRSKKTVFRALKQLPFSASRRAGPRTILIDSVQLVEHWGVPPGYSEDVLYVP